MHVITLGKRLAPSNKPCRTEGTDESDRAAAAAKERLDRYRSRNNPLPRLPVRPIMPYILASDDIRFEP